MAAQRALLSSLYNGARPKIGLEVHAQLKTKSKLFSQGSTNSFAPPNSQLDLFDISLPGTLPKLNQQCLRAAVLTGLALKCDIQDLIHFDRKNYFYTDMPAGYQITQYYKPVALNGYLEFVVSSFHKSMTTHTQRYDLIKSLHGELRRNHDDIEPYVRRSVIKQIQLEQDSAKTLHQADPSDPSRDICSLVDYNRCGVGLVEIVFEPDLTSHDEASSLVKELIALLKAIDTCDCELHDGSLRVDANVSISSIDGCEIHDSARVELKNMNSLRALNRGILHEITRQTKLIKSGDKVLQETRVFEPKDGKTVALRIKEDAIDYRYVPEPNIPPLRIPEDFIRDINTSMPKVLPRDMRQTMISKFNLDLLLICDLIEEPELANFFLTIMEGIEPKYANTVADFLVYTCYNLKNSVGLPFEVAFGHDSEFMQVINSSKWLTIVKMMLTEQISYSTAYDLIKYYCTYQGDASSVDDLIDHLGWKLISDRAEIEVKCRALIKGMKDVSKRYKKTGEKRFLFRMLDKLSDLNNNRVNMNVAIEVLNELLRPAIKEGSEADK